MPLYHYECTTCGQRFEVHQKMDAPTPPPPPAEPDEDDPDYVCPQDGQACVLEKRMTLAGFKFGAGSCDGWGSWERGGVDGETMVRQVSGTMDGRKEAKVRKDHEPVVSVPRKANSE